MIHGVTGQTPQFRTRAQSIMLSRPFWLILFVLITGMLVGCGGPALPLVPKPQGPLPPLTPAAPVPLAQLHWCSNVTATRVQPSFPILLPPTLSADYCLYSVTASSTRFTIRYHHSFYNNSFSLVESMPTGSNGPPGVQSCQFAGPFEPMPSEPYPHSCTGVLSNSQKQLLKIELSAPEAIEDIRSQFQGLQPDIAFLPG